jgi:hypothetical protein
MVGGPLYPGASAEVRVIVHNDSTAPVQATGFRVEAGDAAPGCAASNLVIATTGAAIEVAPGEFGAVAVGARMAPTAPDACKEVVFPLRATADLTGDDPVVLAEELVREQAVEGGPAVLRAASIGGRKKATPGGALALRGANYPAECSTVYFFLDGDQIGTAKPGPGGQVRASGIVVPGQTKDGRHTLTSSCSPSGAPVEARTVIEVEAPTVHLTALATSTPRPDEIDFSPKAVAGTAGVALALVLAIAFSCELFNHVFEKNNEEIVGWIRRLLPERWREPAPKTGDGDKGGGIPRLLAFLLVGGLLFALIDPNFGFNLSSLVLLASMMVSLVIISFVFVAPLLCLMVVRHKDKGVFETVPGSLAIGLVCVAVSRVLHFTPGFLYGVLARMGFRTELQDDTEGRVTALSALTMMFVSVLAWVAWIPVSEAARVDEPSVLLVMATTVLSTVFICGLESSVFAMLPLKFMIGNSVVVWSRIVWAAVFGLGVFCYVHILLRPSTGYVSGGAPSMRAVGVSTVVMVATAVGLWAYFRFRRRPEAGGGDDRGGREAEAEESRELVSVGSE